MFLTELKQRFVRKLKLNLFYTRCIILVQCYGLEKTTTYHCTFTSIMPYYLVHIFPKWMGGAGDKNIDQVFLNSFLFFVYMLKNINHHHHHHHHRLFQFQHRDLTLNRYLFYVIVPYPLWPSSALQIYCFGHRRPFRFIPFIIILLKVISFSIPSDLKHELEPFICIQYHYISHSYRHCCCCCYYYYLSLNDIQTLK